MAEKKTKETDEIIKEIAEEPASDPWSEMRQIYVPPKGNGDQEFIFVGVNGRVFQVPCNGEVQSVPLPVYEVLLNSRELQKEAAANAKKALQRMMDSARAVNLA